MTPPLSTRDRPLADSPAGSPPPNGAAPRPSVEALFAGFPPADDLPAYEVIPADDVPQPYHGLLVHEHHMTVTVEAFHQSPVDVRILARRQDGAFYSRKILLALQSTGRVVQFGIMRINLDLCSAEVRAEIVAGRTPLGRILIEHDVLRRIELLELLRLDAGPKQMAWFGLRRPRPLYGRLAVIHCDGRPAVELLEVVAPE
jgi:chorismate-pyruvate lyase